MASSHAGEARDVVALAWAGLAVATATAVGWRSIRRLEAITRVARRLANGERGAIVDHPGRGVLGSLATSLNELAATLAEEHEAATTDALTGVANRGTLLSALFTEVDRATRHGRPLSVALIDLDQFELINERHGREAGDIVLHGVAGLFRTHLRRSDLLGRYGGEEFMVVLPETPPEEATIVAEKLRMLVQRSSFHASAESMIEVTVSVGVAGGRGRALLTESLVRDADQALRAAKSLGRNQTYVFLEPDDDARSPRSPISSAVRTSALAVTDIVRTATEIALSEVIEPMPHYGGKPSVLIATIAVAIARDLDLPEREVERIRVAALLHDIGKVAVPMEVLDKPGSLSTAEWDFVRQHPRAGQVIVDEAGGLLEVGKIVLHHHERFGGNGYPDGLRGAEIPLGSRIVSIADAYDAMIQDRPYKRAIDHEQAIEELRRHAGSQFDPTLVDIFVRLYDSHAPAPDERLLAARAPGHRRLARSRRATA